LRADSFWGTAKLFIFFGVLFGAVGATIWFAVAARRRGCGAALTAVGTISFFGGTIIATLGAAHLIAVTSSGVTRGSAFVYDFRFYALVHLGVLLIAGGVACFISGNRLTRGEPRAWKTTLWVTVALLAINVPLIPIQGFAQLFSALAFVNLVALVVTRKRFGPSAAHFQ
jgi:hypothetical protein